MPASPYPLTIRLMLGDLRRIVKFRKGSRRKRYVVALLHVLLWPVLSIPRLVWPRRRRTDVPRRIFLARVDGIGDLAMTAAVFPSLRRQFPDAEIDLLVSDEARPVAELFLEAGWISAIERLPLLRRGARAYWELSRQLRERGYDAAVDLRGDFRTVLLMWLAGAPQRVGLAGAGLNYLLTDPVDLPDPTHQAVESAEMIRQLGVEHVEPWPRLPLRESDLASADASLADHGINRDRPLCAFHLGAFYHVKLWPVERFAEVARRLISEFSAQVVVIGGPGEIELAEKFQSLVEHPIRIATGKTSLLTTAAILSRATVFIGTDSGPAHLAAGVGCPVVVLFGPAPPELYHPRSPAVVVLRPGHACDPRCDKHCARPATHCMLDHTPDTVAEAAGGLIRQRIGNGGATTRAKLDTLLREGDSAHVEN